MDGSAGEPQAEVRERICEAMLDLVTSQGYEETSIEEIVEKAGATQAEFDRLFASKADCAIAVFSKYQVSIDRAIITAYESEKEWPDSLRAAGYAAARWMVENPRAIRFGTIEVLWVSELSQARREEGFLKFVGMVDAGRERAKDPDSIPAFTAEGVIGSVTEMMTKHLQRGDVDPYEFVPELMYLAVRPYLGEEAAARELTIPPPPRPTGD